MTAWCERDEEPAEHECPAPLEREVGEFQPGGMFWSPAARWESIADRSLEPSFLVTLVTDKATWTFTRSAQMPYLPQYRASEQRYVRVHEWDHRIEVSVGAERGWGHGHVLVDAHQVRGAGWEITDRRDGGVTLEHFSVASKALARSEVNRRARAHAKRLGLTVFRPERVGAR